MATLADVALNCAKQIQRANATGTAIVDLEDEIKNEIQETIRFYNRKPWSLKEVRGATLTTVSGTVWYSIIDVTTGDGDQTTTGRTPVNVNDITDITYARENPGSSQLNEPMTEIRYRDFEELFEGSAPGTNPTYFTRYAGQIGIWPTPDAAYNLYFSADIKPVVPSADADTSIWFEQAREMIECGALKRVCIKHLRDLERAQTFAAIEQGAEDAFELENTLKQATGKLKSHD